MKFTKLSLIAAIAVSSAFAGGDIAPVEPAEAPKVFSSESKISGQASLWYLTSDQGAAVDMFNKNGAAGDAALRLDYSRGMFDGMATFNAGVQMLSTLGLEGELVSNTFAGHGPAIVDDAMWIDVFNVTFNVANTTIVAGRQALDTPFFYTETWNIAKNTFDAVAVVNNDLPETTLVGAWVGRGNGTPGYTVMADNTSINGGMDDFTAANNPAYAAGAITKLIPNSVAQAWYYKIPEVAQAAWLQIDASLDNITLGAQYAWTDLTSTGVNTDAWAVKVGYAVDAFGVWGAYSQRSDDNGIDISNIATGHTLGSQSKLYTEAYWAYGYVGEQDAETFAIGGHYDFGFATINAQYTDVETGAEAKSAARDMDEFYIGTSVDLGPVKTTLAYTNTAIGKLDGSDGDRFNTLIVMIDMPFEL